MRKLRTYKGMTNKPLHTIVELNSFRRAAEKCGFTNREILDIIDFLATNPNAGDEIPGTGGCRKIRYKLEGNNKGKSGGARIITLFTGDELPIFLITVFSKSQKINLTKAERNGLKQITSEIVKEYSKRVTKITAGAAQ